MLHIYRNKHFPLRDIFHNHLPAATKARPAEVRPPVPELIILVDLILCFPQSFCQQNNN